MWSQNQSALLWLLGKLDYYKEVCLVQASVWELIACCVQIRASYPEESEDFALVPHDLECVLPLRASC